MFPGVADEPGLDYWRQLAEVRREALNDSLHENEQVRLSVTSFRLRAAALFINSQNVRKISEIVIWHVHDRMYVAVPEHQSCTHTQPRCFLFVQMYTELQELRAENGRLSELAEHAQFFARVLEVCEAAVAATHPHHSNVLLFSSLTTFAKLL